MKKQLPILLFIFSFSAAYGQSNTDSLINARFNRIEKVIGVLREFRIQCYIQPQWQKADTAGITSYAGGNFPANSNNRFLLRRGRFYLSWQHEIVNKKGDSIKAGEFGFDFDATEKGFDALIDFYGKINDPWTGWFGIQGGIFPRPFGYEQSPSVSVMESPEYARVDQVILPNKSELGEAFVFESPRTFKSLYLRFDLSAVNGEGVMNTGVGQASVNTGSYQSAKDFITRIIVGKVFDLGGNTKFGINAGASYYNGRVLQTTNNVYEVVKSSTGEEEFKNITGGTADTNGKFHTYYNRDYYNAYLHLNFDYKIGGKFWGTTMLRGEFITGQEPGQLSSSWVPLGAGTSAPAADLYIRQFRGIIAYFTQSFHYKVGKQLMHSDITLKFDQYNPNTQVSGNEINTVNKFTITDLTFNTLGAGYSWAPVQYFKLTLWYDHVMNASSGIAGWTSDYKKDDVFTLRTQFMIDSWWFNPQGINNRNQIIRLY